MFDSLTKPTVNKEGEKVKPKLTKQEFFKLVSADPDTKLKGVDLENADKKDFERVKAGKYVPWLIKNYLTPKTEVSPDHPMYKKEVEQYKERFMEDLYKVTDDLKKYIRFQHKIPVERRNLANRTVDDLYDEVKDFDLTMATTTKSERKSAPVHPGAKLVYDGKDWRVVEISDKGPAGKEAACFYGGNQQETRWCTSAPGLSWFDRYIKDGPLYVVYNPNDPNVAPQTGLPVERYQFHFQSNQFMDRDDRQQDLVKLLNGKMSEIKDFFKPEFAKGLTVGDGDKLVIESFSQGALGKFIALYGMEDLFKSLPLTITQIQIQNRENNDIRIKLPEDIGKFKNLKMILFDNCIDYVPSSLCECKKLKFTAFINNKSLTEIPSCIGELPNIVFINVKGSPNVIIPDSVRSRAVELGGGMWDFEFDSESE